MSTDSTRRALAGVVLALAPAAVLVTWLLVNGELPSPIATHFRLDGSPDGFSPAGGFTLGFGVAVLALSVLGLVGLVRARRQAVVRVAVALAGGMAWMLALVTLCVLWSQRGTSAGDAELEWYVVFVPLVLAAALGALVHRLVPPGESSSAGTAPAAAPYTLAEGERATWVGRARSRPMLAIGAVLAVVGALGAVWLGPWSLLVAFGGLLLAWVSEILVRVDASGVSAHFGPVGWPRVRAPLRKIEGAQTEEIEPLRWGGWGYRIGPRGTALVVRRGPGLVLTRAEAPDLAITVDDPRGAADLVNALLARESAGEQRRGPM